ncbi:hypothetical protein [Nostoc sp.]|uniref:hypothetical protein n=1 Tax=Nostoc sp. TaxID=1180 RepID=UPI002FF47A7B
MTLLRRRGCANSSRLLRETLPRALLHRKSLVNEVFLTCVYTVALYWGETRNTVPSPFQWEPLRWAALPTAKQVA